MKTPIYDFLRRYAEKDGVRLHMPGHKGKGPLGIEPLDITEIKGADVLGEATGIIGESEVIATRLFRSGRTVYVTSGSTTAIQAMLALTAQKYRHEDAPAILAARGAHRSFLHGVALLDIPVTFMLPKNAKTVYSGVMSAEEVEEAIRKALPKPFAVYITSPNYLGELWDIRAVADVCRKYGLPLLVDNAHGAYLAFLEDTMHPIHLGAYMCADSAHKTLPVLTGGAYLHLSAENDFSLSEIKDAVTLFSSTSPSYLTLASLDLANAALEGGYRERISAVALRLQETRSRLSSAGFHVLESEPLKLVICDENASMLDEAVSAHDIESEFCDGTHLVFMASAENDPSDFDRLEAALLPYAKDAKAPSAAPIPHLGETVLSIRGALFAPKEVVPVSQAKGRVYAEIAASCPPAVPIAICGERIDDEAIAAFRYYGIENVRVVKDI